MGIEEYKFTSPVVPFDYEALMKSLSDLTERYKFLKLNYLGNTILGRGIPMLTLGSGTRQVLYVGAHHGMEWITSMLLVRFVSDFCAFYESGGRIGKTSPRTVFGTHTMTVIPMLNPDGVEYQIHGIKEDNPLADRLKTMCEDSDFSHWQANARGVDLNHNYNAGFFEYKKLEAEAGIEGGCATRYSGEMPESEPETAALCSWIRFQSNLRGVMTLHTQGEEIYYKADGDCPTGSEAVARRLSVLTGYRLGEPAGAAAYGGLTDWCIQKCGVPSFTMECGHGENPLPSSLFFPIYATLRQALFAFPTLL